MTASTPAKSPASFAACGECDWSQYAGGTDAKWLLRAHSHDKHGGPNLWSVATSSRWRPPAYRPEATDYEDHYHEDGS